MSYTGGISPDALQLFAVKDELFLEFVCPRCEKVTRFSLGKSLNIHERGFDHEFECTDPVCVGEGERVGYSFTLEIKAEGYMLGLNDRPLHTP
jgi:hypothetical protein